MSQSQNKWWGRVRDLLAQREKWEQQEKYNLAIRSILAKQQDQITESTNFSLSLVEVIKESTHAVTRPPGSTITRNKSPNPVPKQISAYEFLPYIKITRFPTLDIATYTCCICFASESHNTLLTEFRNRDAFVIEHVGCSPMPPTRDVTINGYTSRIAFGDSDDHFDDETGDYKSLIHQQFDESVSYHCDPRHIVLSTEDLTEQLLNEGFGPGPEPEDDEDENTGGDRCRHGWRKDSPNHQCGDSKDKEGQNET